MKQPKTNEVISEIFGPAPLLTVAYIEVGVLAGEIWLAVLAAVLVAVLPYTALVVLARAGKVSGRFVSNRRQRLPVLLGTLACMAVAVVLLLTMNAPGLILSLTYASIAALFVVMVIGVWWKVSIHCTIATFFFLLQIALFGPIGWVAVIIPITTGWARLNLNAHTLTQVLVGSGIGAVVFTTFYAFLGLAT